MVHAPAARGRLPHQGALAAVCGVLFVTFLDTTIVSVSLSSVQSDLHAGVSALQWVVNGYTLPFACLMLLVGSLGDRFGHRRVMLVGLGVFVAGSVVAATAGSPGQLVAGRVVMGLGAAGSEPGTLAVVRDLYRERRDRVRAVGIWAAVSGLALALGPVVGGLLVGQWSWSAVFWFNVVAGVSLWLTAQRLVPETVVLRADRIDLAGFFLSAAFLFCGVYAVIAGETAGYSAWWVIGLFVLSFVSLVALVVVEGRVRFPMLDMAYLRIPIVGSALVVAFAVYFGIFSIFFFTALYLQQVASWSSTRLALVFAPMAAAIILASLLTGRWLTNTRPVVPMVAGCLVGAAGILVSRGLLGANPHAGWLMLSLALAGLGFGMAVVPLTAVVLGMTPRDHAGLAAAMTNTMRQVGAVVGVAALGALVNAHLTTDLGHRLDALGVPSAFQGLITSAIEQGAVPSHGPAQATAKYGEVVQRVIDATFGAFRDGLHQALLVSALLMVAAAVYTLLATRHGHAQPVPGDDTRWARSPSR
ncbi:MAG: MFS transporter [Marmoricola sp.]